ncbi:RNA polymerase sigma factor [Euzebyella saccharophila]|uniref:RNA polymerase sigma factor n=1 Tax=Euzebyella saccharophila TaxID=679664 RepID=A0ABV8JTJ5_9FLAO|nr:RNA polymerase sigma factor [Euzebyella saccharophila]
MPLLHKRITDEKLVIELISSREPELFGELYDRYADKVFNKCSGFAIDLQEAEDLTKDIFLLLYIKIGSFQGRSKFSTWLYSFVYNFCVNHVNRNKYRKMKDSSRSFEEGDGNPLQEIPDSSLFELKSQKLKKALDQIEPEDKSILLLKYQDDATIKELMALLQIGESAVKMRLKRAKNKVVNAYHNLK